MRRPKLVAGAGLALCLSLTTGVVLATSPWNRKDQSSLPTFPPGQVAPEFAVGSRASIALPKPAATTPAASVAATRTTSTPKPVTPSRAASASKDALRSYIGQRRSSLADVAASSPGTPGLAGVTLRKPIPADDYVLLVKGYGLEITYVEWLLPDADDHGGGPIGNLPQVLAQYPQAEVVYGLASGRADALARAAADPQVWLVDPSSPAEPLPANLYGYAVKFGLTGD
jgi:hypothetical protein